MTAYLQVKLTLLLKFSPLVSAVLILVCEHIVLQLLSFSPLAPHFSLNLFLSAPISRESALLAVEAVPSHYYLPGPLSLVLKCPEPPVAPLTPSLEPTAFSSEYEGQNLGE